LVNEDYPAGHAEERFIDALTPSHVLYPISGGKERLILKHERTSNALNLFQIQHKASSDEHISVSKYAMFKLTRNQVGSVNLSIADCLAAKA